MATTPKGNQAAKAEQPNAIAPETVKPAAETKPEAETKTKAPEPQEETVQVRKTDLAKMFETLERQKKDIETLFAVADKGRLDRAQTNSAGEPLIKTVKLWKWEPKGLYILATHLKTNNCEIVQGRWIEQQDVVLVLEDGTSVEVAYIEFARKTTKFDTAEIVGRSIDETTRETMLKVQTRDGKKIELSEKFVN